MAKKNTGLGRGLGALIPQGGDNSTAVKENKPKTQTKAANKPKPSAVKEESAKPAESSGVFEIRVNDIEANSDQPRTAFSHQGMEELSESIREHGVLQPLAVTPLPDGKYELIAGERRLRAAKLVGLETIPAFIRPTEGSDKLVLALIENIQREDLNPVEEARAYHRLRDEFGLTQEEISVQVGKARSTVANSIRLLDLPEDMLDAVATGAVNSGNARALLAITDPKARRKMFRRMLSGKMTVREAEADVQKASTRTKKDPQLLAMEEELREVYGTKILATSRNGRGKIVMEFYSKEEREELVRKLLR